MLYSQKLSRAIKRHCAAVSRLAALNDEVERLESELSRARGEAARVFNACQRCSADVDRLRREERAA